jgi:hypothetical protein
MEKYALSKGLKIGAAEALQGPAQGRLMCLFYRQGSWWWPARSAQRPQTAVGSFQTPPVTESKHNPTAPLYTVVSFQLQDKP